jgi:hypothetical protein
MRARVGPDSDTPPALAKVSGSRISTASHILHRAANLLRWASPSNALAARLLDRLPLGRPLEADRLSFPYRNCCYAK